MVYPFGYDETTFGVRQLKMIETLNSLGIEYQLRAGSAVKGHKSGILLRSLEAGI